MKINIMIVEDEERMRKLIKNYFIKNDYNVFEAENGVEALDVFKNQHIDLVILDIMIPLMDGWSVCSELRKHSQVPIIMLTAKSEEDDKLLGYELGADDYVTKPFSPKVLVAKSKALLKRVDFSGYKQKNIMPSLNEEFTQKKVLSKEEQSIITFDEITINNLSHEVKIEGESVYLSPKEYDLLLFFANNQGILLSRDKILDKVWGYDYFGGLRTVDTHIKRLREKLGGKAYLIKTIRGIGYKFEV